MRLVRSITNRRLTGDVIKKNERLQQQGASSNVVRDVLTTASNCQFKM
jgi:hypothetical protein